MTHIATEVAPPAPAPIAPSLAPAAVSETPAQNAAAGAAALSGALLSVLLPAVSNMSSRLVDLQQAQHLLVASVNLNRQELADGNDEWKAAKAVLDRIPQYRDRLKLLRSNMAVVQSQLTRIEKGAVLLRSKLEDKAAERAARRAAERGEYLGQGT